MRGPRVAAIAFGLALASAACGQAPRSGDGVDETTGSTGTSATTGLGGNGSGGVTGTLDPIPCETSEDCESGYCVSAYDAAADPPVGPSVCVAECVEAGALDRACTDDASCCGELVCSAQALCVEVEPDTTDTGGTDTGN